MTEQITVPKQTWDLVVNALKRTKRDIESYGFTRYYWHELVTKALTAANAVSEQPQAQGEPLTDEQIKRIYMCETGWSISDNDTSLIDFARAILAAANGITKGITT